MAESTIVLTKQDGTVRFGALGGGAYDTTTGAPHGSTLEYTNAFENGDWQITPPSRTVNDFPDRGRTANPPSLRYGDDVKGSISGTLSLRDLTDASAATLADIMHTLMGNPTGYVGSNWESTRASAAGAGDAEVFSIGVRVDYTDAGNGSNTHSFVANYCTGTLSFADGDPNTLNVDLVIHDRPEDIVWL